MKKTLPSVALLSLAVASCSRPASQSIGSADSVPTPGAQTITVAKDIRHREGSIPAWVLDLAMP